MSFYEGVGFRVVEKYKYTDFPEMYIDMQPIVERMQQEEKRIFVLNKRYRKAADFVSCYWRHIANQRLLNIAEDGKYSSQRGREFLIKIQTDLEHISKSHI